MQGILLASDETLSELHKVLLLPKFDRSIDRALRDDLFREYASHCIVVPIPSPIHACRDPRDDKFLEVAVHGKANAIVTGDLDLLALHPFRGVHILTPPAYLNLE
jgi:putative PIN family toxin of toxin-antitoxin system